MRSILYDVFNTPESRVTFMKGCALLARCDGKVCEKEQEFLLDAAHALQLNEIQKNELYSLINGSGEVDIELRFDTRKQKILFLKEAIHLCHYDGFYDGAEKDQVIEMAQNMGVTSDVVDQIEAWVAESIDLGHRGEEMLKTL